eukprot:6131849-Pleurochrysis_carterae.AAC.1
MPAAKLAEQVGLQEDCVTTPARGFEDQSDKIATKKRWGDRVKRHVAAVVKGRCDDDASASLVVKALRTGLGEEGLQRLRQTP